MNDRQELHREHQADHRARVGQLERQPGERHRLHPRADEVDGLPG
jgi:hypothetical protein